MPHEFQDQPSEIGFEITLRGDLAGVPATLPTLPAGPSSQQICRKSPFAHYSRMLTAEGGILIVYKDLALGGIYTFLRVMFFIAATYFELWALCRTALSSDAFALLFAFAMLGNVIATYWKIKIGHSVEIRHDRMILDGKHVFWATDIGQNFPQLQRKDDDPNRMTIAGICGTRFVEYMTANRIDDNDRTPEVLIADLQDAMQKLWGRSEVTFGG
jgi:hypothetical protein